MSKRSKPEVVCSTLSVCSAHPAISHAHPPISLRREMPLTRGRLRTLASHVIFDEDLLRLLFTHSAVRDLEQAAAVCKMWCAVSRDSFAVWRRQPGIYVVGGCSDGPHPAQALASRQVRKYDVNGDAWIPCAALRKPRDHLGLVGWQGRLHALGGWSGKQNRGSCETYDPSADVWTTSKQRLLIARSGLSVAVSEDDGILFAIAGWGGAHLGFLSSAECLQAEPALPPTPPSTPQTSSSAAASPMSSCSSVGVNQFALPDASISQSRDGGRRSTRSGSSGSAGAASSSDGSASSGASGTGGAPEVGAIADSALSLSSLPVPPSANLHMARHCPAAAALGRFVYLTGGSGTPLDAEAAALGAQPTATVERLDMRKMGDGWDASVAPMLMPRYRHAVAVVSGQLYACGGQKPDGRATATVERYDPVTNSWHEVSPMKHPRFSHAMAALNGKLYVVGGFANGQWLQSVERYDAETDQWEDLADLGEGLGLAAHGLAVC